MVWDGCISGVGWRHQWCGMEALVVWTGALMVWDGDISGV